MNGSLYKQSLEQAKHVLYYKVHINQHLHNRNLQKGLEIMCKAQQWTQIYQRFIWRHWEKIQFHKFQDHYEASGWLCRFLGGRNFLLFLRDLCRWDFWVLNFRGFLGVDFKGSARYNCGLLKVEFPSIFTGSPSTLLPTPAASGLFTRYGAPGVGDSALLLWWLRL